MKINQKGFTLMVIFIALAIIGLVGVVLYYYINNQSFSAKDKVVTEQTQPNSIPANTNQQKPSPESTVSDNSPKGLEVEAKSIKLETAESGFSDIDKDLMELK